MAQIQGTNLQSVVIRYGKTSFAPVAFLLVLVATFSLGCKYSRRGSKGRAAHS